jgi:hypothetical protein
MPCNPVFQFSKLITAAGRKTTDMSVQSGFTGTKNGTSSTANDQEREKTQSTSQHDIRNARAIELPIKKSVQAAPPRGSISSPCGWPRPSAGIGEQLWRQGWRNRLRPTPKQP